MDNHFNQTRLERDLKDPVRPLYEGYWKDRNTNFIAPEIFTKHPTIYLEIGAGTGWFFLDLAKRQPDKYFIAVERDRMRGNQLVYRAKRAALNNISAYRGNAIPAMIHGVPDSCVDRIYMLYPCPWPKTSQRKHRWYVHPMMRHLVRVLKPRGLIIWASDQSFYIAEATYVSEKKHGLEVLASGQLQPNPYNNLEDFPEGRTKFEHHFLASGQPCYELVARKK